MVRDKQSGHIGEFSMDELTSVLYEDFDIGGEDKLILSKGRTYNMLLHELGKISDKDLDLFRDRFTITRSSR